MAFNLFPQTDFRQMDLNYVLEVSKQAAANLEEYAADKEQVVATQAAAEQALATALEDIQTATQAATSASQDAQTASGAAQTATQAAASAEQDAQTASAAAQRAEQVQESIPADYTDLSNQVSELKSDLNAVAETANIEVINVTNLLGNDGKFENFAPSANSWYFGGSGNTATATDGILTFKAGAQFGSIRHAFTIVANHKYYFWGTLKTTGNSGKLSISINEPMLSIPYDDAWHFCSDIYTQSADGTATFCISDSASTPENIYAQKCGVIDLTAAFGAGNEPTKNKMDVALQKINGFIVQGDLYFEGEVVKPYYGKKILFIGDSITAANLNDNGWCKYFNEIMKPSLSVNVAVSGATWSDNEDTVYNGNPSTYDQTNNTIGNQVEKIARGKDTTNPNYSHVANYDEFDIIIISAGTNDNRDKFNADYIKDALVSAGNVPLPYASIDTKNAVGAMAYAYERMYTMYPDAKYFYCTPIQAYPVKKGWGEIQEKGNVMKTMGDYIPPLIIDSEKCGIFGNQEQYTTEGVNLADGLHPNAHGAKLLGVYNANAVISHLLTDL